MHQTPRSGQETQPCTERLNAVSHNVEKLKLDLHNRDGLLGPKANSRYGAPTQ